jgi:hypothetical protein
MSRNAQRNEKATVARWVTLAKMHANHKLL